VREVENTMQAFIIFNRSAIGLNFIRGHLKAKIQDV
jgi:hypothetical protein